MCPQTRPTCFWLLLQGHFCPAALLIRIDSSIPAHRSCLCTSNESISRACALNSTANFRRSLNADLPCLACLLLLGLIHRMYRGFVPRSVGRCEQTQENKRALRTERLRSSTSWSSCCRNIMLTVMFCLILSSYAGVQLPRIVICVHLHMRCASAYVNNDRCGGRRASFGLWTFWHLFITALSTCI